MTARREPVMQAVLDLVSTSSDFKTVARRLKLWGDVSASEQPALFVVEPDEVIAPRPRGFPSKVTLTVNLVIYFQVGSDTNATPSIEVNNLLDAIQDAVAPKPGQEVQTLGGLVDHCWIEGRVFKDPGDLDGQGLIIVPLKILLP